MNPIDLSEIMPEVCESLGVKWLSKDHLRAIKLIKAKGFTHIKVECEAHTNRDCSSNCDYCDEGRITCPECEGNYETDCYDCDGTGYVRSECPECGGTGRLGDGDDECDCPECNGNGEIEYTCDSCDGSGYFRCDYCEDGYVECPECNGYWEGDGDYDDGYVEELIQDRLTEAQREALKYSNVYYDGSVDTEWTFTCPIENIAYLPTYLEAFKATCDDIGDCETANAGMHISLMTSESLMATRIDSRMFDNFQAQVSKMINGLMLTSGPQNRTRGFNYRKPQVSSHDKYSAIYSRENRLIEYRFFDTCYDEPQRILDNILIIAKTLRYYSKAQVKIDNYAIEMMEGYNGSWLKFSDIFDTTTKVDRLKTEAEALLGKRMAARELKLKMEGV